MLSFLGSEGGLKQIVMFPLRLHVPKGLQDLSGTEQTVKYIMYRVM